MRNANFVQNLAQITIYRLDEYQGFDCNDDGIGESLYTVGSYVIDYLPICDRKDTFKPEITIVMPINRLYSNQSPEFHLSIEEYILKDVWYTLDDGITNTTIKILHDFINQSLWNLLDSGTINLIFYAKDLAGNIGSAQISLYKDCIAPQLQILSPVPNQFFDFEEGEIPYICLNLIEANPYEMWYIIDDDETKYYFSDNCTLDSNLWEKLPYGFHTLKIYATDMLGNSNYTQVTFVKYTPSEEEKKEEDKEKDGDLNVFIVSIIIIGSISTSSVGFILYKKKYKI